MYFKLAFNKIELHILEKERFKFTGFTHDRYLKIVQFISCNFTLNIFLAPTTLVCHWGICQNIRVSIRKTTSFLNLSLFATCSFPFTHHLATPSFSGNPPNPIHSTGNNGRQSAFGIQLLAKPDDHYYFSIYSYVFSLQLKFTCRGERVTSEAIKKKFIVPGFEKLPVNTPCVMVMFTFFLVLHLIGLQEPFCVHFILSFFKNCAF